MQRVNKIKKFPVLQGTASWEQQWRTLSQEGGWKTQMKDTLSSIQDKFVITGWCGWVGKLPKNKSHIKKLAVQRTCNNSQEMHKFIERGKKAMQQEKTHFNIRNINYFAPNVSKL